MTATATPAAVIAGLGTALPARVVTNAMLAQRLDTSDEWIRRRTGIGQRRVVEQGTATSDLAVEAGARALKSARSDGADLVVLATTTPDFPCPATAPEVACRLGLGPVGAFDVAAVCSGFVYALAVGSGAIAAGLGTRVLVIGADTFSTIIDPTDRGTATIFGDGAGAVLLRAGERTEPGAVLAVDLGSDGTLTDIMGVPAGGSRQRTSGREPEPAESWFTMRGNAVFKYAVQRMVASTRAVLDRTGWATGDVDRLVAHQANIRIIAAVAAQLGLPPERAVTNLERVGNTAAASIPLALADGVTAETVRPGHRVAVTSFGGGASWGSVTFVWPEVELA